MHLSIFSRSISLEASVTAKPDVNIRSEKGPINNEVRIKFKFISAHRFTLFTGNNLNFFLLFHYNVKDKATTGKKWITQFQSFVRCLGQKKNRDLSNIFQPCALAKKKPSKPLQWNAQEGDALHCFAISWVIGIRGDFTSWEKLWSCKGG